MLFLGVGTGLGSTLIVDGIVESMELGTSRAPSKTTSAFADTSAWARRNGGVLSLMWLPG